MELVKAPPVTIIVGQHFEYTLRLEDPTAETPIISLDGYSVAWSISNRAFSVPFDTGVGSILDDRVIIEITQDKTAAYAEYALPVIGGRPSAVMQISLTGPTAPQNIIVQLAAIIAGTFGNDN